MLSKKRFLRKKRIRARIFGTKDRPRLSLFRSNRYIYAQVINDVDSHTLVSAKGDDPKDVGNELVRKANLKKIKSLVFDRSGYRYHGRVKKIGDTIREGGINI